MWALSMIVNEALKQENTSISLLMGVVDINVLVVDLEKTTQSMEQKTLVKMEWGVIGLSQYTRFYMIL